jgi:hypothetical protein
LEASDFNLSPSRYVFSSRVTQHLDIQDILDTVASLNTEANAIDEELARVFTSIGYAWRS